jgi:CHASE3 domain sensor protein
MKLGIRKSFRIFAPGHSLRRRTAYSLAIVRLILVPVIFLAVYYLFRMGWIVDRIVNVDAPAAAQAQQASIEMLEARRAERNYLLLHDPNYLEANRQALGKMRAILQGIRDLGANDDAELERASDAVLLYQQRFAAAVSALGPSGRRPSDRIQAVVRAYEQDLDDLLKKSRTGGRQQLVDDLRKQIGSFDSQIAQTAQENNPQLQRVTEALQVAAENVLQATAALEALNWNHVQQDHAQARHLIRQAEWALGIVSFLTLLISIWVSYTLPKQVIKPLLSLKEAVDHAASGNEIEFEVHGKGEVADLAHSLRNMFERIRPRV